VIEVLKVWLVLAVPLALVVGAVIREGSYGE